MTRRQKPALLGWSLLLLAGCQATSPTRPRLMTAPTPTPATPTASVGQPINTKAAAADEASPAESPSAVTNAAEAGGATEDAVRTGAQVFAALGARLDTSGCADTAARNPWYSRYLGHAHSLQIQLATALPLLDYVDREVKAAGVPAEFTIVPLVESGYRPAAISAGGPLGLWQLIRSTARNHGVRIADDFDSRLSPLDSTRAALSYVRTLQPMFDNWQAMAMAYNAGENRMRRVMAADDRPVSASDRHPRGLSNTTYNYVAKIEALSCLLAAPPAALTLPADVEFVPLVPVNVPMAIRSLATLGAATGVPVAEIRKLNPGYRRKLGGNAANRSLLLPVVARERLETEPSARIAATEPAAAPSAALASRDIPTTDVSSAPGRHEVKPGDTLWSIARRYGLSLETLLKINQLRIDAPIRPGQTLRLSP